MPAVRRKPINAAQEAIDEGDPSKIMAVYQDYVKRYIERGWPEANCWVGSQPPVIPEWKHVVKFITTELRHAGLAKENARVQATELVHRALANRPRLSEAMPRWRRLRLRTLPQFEPPFIPRSCSTKYRALCSAKMRTGKSSNVFGICPSSNPILTGKTRSRLGNIGTARLRG